MWDNVPLLRSTANFLFGISMLLLLIGGVRYSLNLPYFPLNTVKLKTAPKQVSVELIERVIDEQIRGNFFSVDLQRTRQAFEQLPWVRKVNVRRQFPWSLEVELEEHEALARWNGAELVNTHGEVFDAETDLLLPTFNGQADTAKQVVDMYFELSKQIQPLQQEISQINLSPRFSWQVKLSDGMVLELGRELMQLRMARFAQVYSYSLATISPPPMQVDLRYRNGFTAHLPNRANLQEKTNSGNKA
ncbi:MAG: cell division protein FtsQ/DivIB [Gallionellaceae bacterium]|jgi:cell division protein FtsQ